MSDDIAAEQNKIVHMVLDDKVGGVIYYNTNMVLIHNGTKYGETNTNGRYIFDTSSITIRQITTAINFYTDVQYTIELYA